MTSQRTGSCEKARQSQTKTSRLEEDERKSEKKGAAECSARISWPSSEKAAALPSLELRAKRARSRPRSLTPTEAFTRTMLALPAGEVCVNPVEIGG